MQQGRRLSRVDGAAFRSVTPISKNCALKACCLACYTVSCAVACTHTSHSVEGGGEHCLSAALSTAVVMEEEACAAVQAATEGALRDFVKDPYGAFWSADTLVVNTALMSVVGDLPSSHRQCSGCTVAAHALLPCTCARLCSISRNPAPMSSLRTPVYRQCSCVGCSPLSAAHTAMWTDSGPSCR